MALENDKNTTESDTIGSTETDKKSMKEKSNGTKGDTNASKKKGSFIQTETLLF